MREPRQELQVKTAVESRTEEYRRIVNDKLLRHLVPGEGRLFSLQPPLRFPKDVRMEIKQQALLRDTGQRRFHMVSQWPELGLNSGRYPILCCVYEGVADWRAGVTRRMAAALPGLAKQPGCYTLRMPLHTFFLIPPGVPFDDGARSHWDGAFGETSSAQSHAHILWIEVLHTGAVIHTCLSRGESHTISPALFVFDAQLTVLIELLTSELHGDGAYNQELAFHYLSCMLLLLARALAAGRSALAEGMSRTDKFGDAQGSDARENSHESETVLRACRYIETHLIEPINVDDIASQAFVSPAQLNRLFRAHLQASPMKVVLERRMEAAKSLLKNTDLPVQVVGGYVGYRHLSHFSRLFTQYTKATPSAYRKANRAHNSPDAIPNK